MDRKNSPAGQFYRNRNQWVDYVSERTDLHPTTRLIGCWIARRINEENRDTWYQESTMAERLGVSVRTIIRAVRKLEVEELLLVHRDGQRGIKKAVNRYELIYPWL